MNLPAAESPIFEPAFVARYDTNGPRYTSYPTAPYFQPDFGEVAYRKQVQESNQERPARALSLYLHVPFCFSPCFYCGCHRIITSQRGQAEVYLLRLLREIEMTAALFPRDRPVVQLHLGGGTPNFFGANQMEDLMECLGRHFRLSQDPDREFGIELDPRYADADYVARLGRLGFNRLSVGIQDFDPAVQEAVNRHQSVEQTAAVLEAARTQGFRSVSVDLIYGLPRQTQAGFSRTLDQVIALRPDRVAAYSYAHLPEMFKAQRQIDAAQLPSATDKLALLALCVEKLSAAGYRYVGMDHFALASDDLVKAQDEGSLQRNFQGYSTHGHCDLVGLGMSSISRIGNSYSQNAKDLVSYYAAIDAGHLPVCRGLRLSTDDLIRRDAISELMCHGRLDIAAFERRHGIDFTGYFASETRQLEQLETDGLLRHEAGSWIVTARGRFLLRVVAMAFDAYLNSVQPAKQRYSRTV